MQDPSASYATLSTRVEQTLDETYREVELTFHHLEDGTFKRLWQRAVADRVRVMSIGPYFVCDALDHNERLSFRRTARMVQALLERFRHLEKYHILWHERPSMTLRPPFASSHSLRILTVECSLYKAEFLFSPETTPHALEEFNLCVRDDAGNSDSAGYIMIHHLARFLNNMQSTLRSFSLETSLETDFSPLFLALGFFVRLSTLALSIPMSDAHFRNPSALKGFLNLHRGALKCLSLHGHPTSPPHRTGTRTGGRWLSEALTGIMFTSLQTLNLNTSFVQLDIVILCVRQWAVSKNQLDSLRVSPECLCPELIDMLAQHLPSLTKLYLRVRSFAPHRFEAASQLGRFCTEMSIRKYQGWKLRDIDVWMFARRRLQFQYCYTAPPPICLPSEIWMQIADYLPPQMVGDLYTVNSQWFDIAMNARYNQVSFAFLNRAMLRDLDRLRDPAVARRVRTLHVHPYFVKEIMERTQEPSPITTCRRPLPAHHHPLRGKFKLARGLFRDRDHRRIARGTRTSALHEFGSPADLVQTLVDVISRLPNVTHYHIAWSGLHSISDFPVPFLAAAFSPSVLQLTLEISLEKTVDLLSHTAALENLEELDLFLRLDHTQSAETYEQILVDHLAPAINRLHSSLQKLSLRLCEPLDISPLFDSLRVLPVLDCLSLSIPMARPHLGHPSGLGNFLNRHRHSLRHLALRASELSGDGLMPAEDPLSEWINDALSFVTGPVKLRTLEVSLTLFPVEATAMVLGRFARTLHSLTLTGRHLPWDRVDELLGAVRRSGATRLSTLRLGAITLSPELIDLLAEKLPSLRRLELLVRDVVGCEGDLPLYYDGPEQDDNQIGNFLSEMELRRYPDWGLRSISLTRSSFPYRLQYAADYRDVFLECIPSLARAY
ncbi:polygalacturonase 3 [Favolaschia claudopus]|uniref:Polygalacturonase 3 n=1 Tax=Favolaschia claudopus TaxID=2862362 RepID=A0AAW0BYW8_9AGAR